MLNSYKDRQVLVTGASAGIGREMARQLAAQGAHLILVARRRERLEELSRECAKQGVRTLALPLDLAAPNAAKQCMYAVRAAGWQVDVLINNAGIGVGGPCWEIPMERVHQLLQLNINALVELTYYALPDMLQRGQGGILNVSSLAGEQAIPRLGIYAASKAFVTSFSESLRVECLGRGVHVSALCPGTTDTEFFEAAHLPAGRMRTASMQAAAPVAAAGLRGLLRNQPVMLTSWKMRVAYLLSKFLPRRLVVRAAGWSVA